MSSVQSPFAREARFSRDHRGRSHAVTWGDLLPTGFRAEFRGEKTLDDGALGARNARGRLTPELLLRKDGLSSCLGI